MLEDAFILKDAAAAAELFEDSALLIDRAASEARGRAAIAQAIARDWKSAYVANSSQVFQAGDLALSLGLGVSVLRRRPDGEWRLAIALLNNSEETHD